MEIYILVTILIIAALYFLTRKNKHQPKQNIEITNDIPLTEDSKDLDYKNAYKSRWMFSYNEKAAFEKIKEITDKHGMYLFAKVRLYDLIEPKPGIEKYKTAQYKIQAKHVDFVVCNEKLVAKTIIELDDSSHTASSRQARDNFVDEVLSATGYRVIRLKAVNQEQLEELIFPSHPAMTNN